MTWRGKEDEQEGRASAQGGPRGSECQCDIGSVTGGKNEDSGNDLGGSEPVGGLGPGRLNGFPKNENCDLKNWLFFKHSES